MVFAIEAHSDIGGIVGTLLVKRVLYIGPHLATQSRIAIDHVLYSSHRGVIIRIWIDAEPQFCRIDVNGLVAKDRPTDVSTHIAYAGDRPQFLTGAGDNAAHLGMRGPWRAFKPYAQIRFLKSRDCFTLSHKWNGDNGCHHQDDDCQIGKPRTFDRARQVALIAALHPCDHRRLSNFQAGLGKQKHTQSGGYRHCHDHRSNDSQHIRNSHGLEQRSRRALNEEDRHDNQQGN